MLDGIGAIALVLIASFGVDRITAGILFLLRPATSRLRLPSWISRGPDNKEELPRYVYLALAAIIGGVVLSYLGQVRIFHALGFNTINAILDTVLTGLIFVGGADCVGRFLNRAQGPDRHPDHAPIQVTGTLVLDQDGAKHTRAAAE